MKKFLIFVMALVLFFGPIASMKVEAQAQAAMPPTMARWLFEWMGGQILDRTYEAIFGGGGGSRGTQKPRMQKCTVWIQGKEYHGDEIVCEGGHERCEPIACNGWLKYE